MAIIILASSFNSSARDENDNQISHVIPDFNNFLSNIKKYTPSFNRVVIVANDPTAFEINDMRGGLLFKSLEMSGLKFKQQIILDDRNKKDATAIINGADVIFLSGGKLGCQLEFFAEIGLRDIMKNHKGLFIGGSAGAMNLCETVFEYPEFPEDIDNRTEEKYFIKGLGFHNEILIPHFDIDTMTLGHTEGIDVVKDYILPKSHGREFIAFPDDSYILLDGGRANYFGTFYKVKDGSILTDTRLDTCTAKINFKKGGK